MTRVAIVTGTRKGLGRAIASWLLDGGWQVAGCSRGPSDIALENYCHYELDVADESAVVEMVRGVSRRCGRIDALINNAGIGSMNHFVLTPLATAQSIFNTNFFGSFLFCREAAKVMIRQASGRIVNFSTVATPLRLEGEALYAASKAAIESMTRVLARELGGCGITVNAVGPTPIPTDLIRNVPKEKLNALLARQAITRFGSEHDVINVIDFFLRPKSDFVTGQVIYLGGI